MRWTLLALILSVSISTGCAGRPSAKPPLARIPTERPAILDAEGRITAPGVGWLSALVNAYVLNCTALSVLRGEDVRQCRAGLE